MKQPRYIAVNVYFDRENEEQMKMLKKIDQLVFRKKIESKSHFLRSVAYKHLIDNNLIKW